jgi:hypothetical protein
MRDIGFWRKLFFFAVALLVTACGDNKNKLPAVDLMAPTIVSFSPAADAADVEIDAVVSVTFSEPMSLTTLTATTFLLTAGQDGDAVAADVNYDPATATVTLTPKESLAFGTVYSATLLDQITDRAGNPLKQAFTWTFTTGPADWYDVYGQACGIGMPAPGCNYYASGALR